MKISKPNRALLAVAVCLCMTAFGCNATEVATKTQGVVAAVIAVAQAEQGVVPAGDQAAYVGFTNLAVSLDGQLAQCISNVTGLMGTKAKFLSCFNTFASGLLSPTELAQLRILSPGTQAKVQLYLTGIVAGLNVAIAAFGGTPTTVPAVSAYQPTEQDMQNLRAQVIGQGVLLAGR